MTRRIAGVPIVMLVLGLGMVASACSAESTSGPTPTVTVESDPQPYAGWETRPIGALAPERVDDLLAGRGAGYALAAELNHYPGPTHVLQLADELALTSEQERAVQRTFIAMQRDAQALGSQLVDLEAELDEAFQTGAITASRLEDLTSAIGEVEGALRNVHLAAHLEVASTLSVEQVSRYDALRGYGAGDSEHDGRTGHGSH